MNKIRFINYYGKFNTNILDTGNQNYGNYLAWPGYTLANELVNYYNYEIVFDNSFDTIVFFDLDEELYKYAQSLPDSIKKILVLIESPIYTPFAHILYILSDKMWHSVITYNREFYLPNIRYYDIAITGIQMPVQISNSIESEKGCHIASYKNDSRGYSIERNNLIKDLENKDEIDVYGNNWPINKNYKGKSSNKIYDISKYPFYFACENAKYSGYVTEKIADSILAERPCIYFGDTENAQRRFPDTFVPISELSYEAYIDAKNKLLENYDFYKKNVLEQKKLSTHWCDSFFTELKQAILN